MQASEVTIVIPVRNREETLPRLFRSLDAVEWQGLAVVIVDNGSTDGSLPLCREYAAHSRHRTTVLQEPQAGANCARNRGLATATTEWVYFFDSDDELSPDFLLNLMPMAKGCDMLAFPTCMERGGRLRIRDFVPSSSVASQMVTGTLSTQSVIWRTQFIRSIGGWNESLTVWQDWELGVRSLSRSPQIMWCKERAYHTIHLSDSTITATTTIADRQQTLLSVHPFASTAKERRALHLRSQILAGQSGVDVHLPLSPSFGTRLAGALLRLHARLGMRGAWRMALWLCR